MGGGWRARKDIIAQQCTCYAYRPRAYFTVIAVIHHQLYILLRDGDHIVIINTTNGWRIEGCIINIYFFSLRHDIRSIIDSLPRDRLECRRDLCRNNDRRRRGSKKQNHIPTPAAAVSIVTATSSVVSRAVYRGS